MNVLVVDDDPAICKLLELVLARAGHNVETSSNAFGLCNRLAGRSDLAIPDVLVLDHVLPGLSGGSCLEILARDSRARHVPVVLHSSLMQDDLAREARGHPRCIPLQKSGRTAPLLDAVEQAGRLGAAAAHKR